MRMFRPLWGFVVFALLLSVVACGDDGETSTSTTSTAPSSTSSSDTSATEPTTVEETVVQVFFVDEDAFNQGVPPYVQPVERTVSATTPAAGALEELFSGPTDDESATGLTFVASEATGFADLRIEDGTAHVRLTGGCSSGGSTLTIAAEIVPTLLQFPTVDAVKIYDPDGTTQEPDTPGDSVPACLEP